MLAMVFSVKITNLEQLQCDRQSSRRTGYACINTSPWSLKQNNFSKKYQK